MCGIVGIVSKDARKWISACNAKIAHRGPDSSGEFVNGNLAFGFQRLAIQDLSSNGNQPMHSADGRFTLIFNGEIYNHLDIRQEIAHKYPFKSTSDTETILYGFIEYGVDLLKRLNGIFALAIFDNQTQDLWVARDHFGIKPVYYYHKGADFVFGSEIKSFVGLPGFDKAIDFKALVNYVFFLWSPNEKTPFLNVKKLLPGHFLHINTKDPSVLRIEKYYEIPFDGTYSDKSEQELIDELDSHLYRAVERQLLSDVPVGFFLSGGLDSSAVVAMAKRILPDQKLTCYTIDTGEKEGFEGFSNDLRYAQIVGKHLDIDLKIVKADIDIMRDFDKIIYHLDEPQADAAPLNVLNICRAARQNGHIVLLGGTAGDDLFSGYRRHQVLRLEPYLAYVPDFLIRYGQKFTEILPSQHPSVRRLKKVMRELMKPKMERLLNYFSWISVEKAKVLFRKDRQEALVGYSPVGILSDALKNIPYETSDLNQMLFLDLKFFLTDHNLNYTDKLSMATGVEVRVPFLDKELVEFACNIPPELKMKGMTTKYLLRKVMERYLPHEIIYRPKSGFGAPIRQWIQHDMDAYIKSAFSRENIEKQGIFDFDEVWKAINDNKAGKIDASYTILSLLSIESWVRQFIFETP